MKKLTMILISMIGFASSANALFEARLTYGLLGTKADLSTVCPTCTGAPPSIVPTYGLGADLILAIPFPLLPGLGVRYESMGLSADANGIDIKADYTRTALIANARIIDTLIFFGPIFTYGLSHTTSLKASQGGNTQSNFSTSNATSYSLGLEAGAHLLGFLIGAEVGYMDFRWKNAIDSTGNAATRDINMSGTYAKVLLGLSL